jgi:hypothetical protein
VNTLKDMLANVVVGAKSLVVWMAWRYARAKAQDTLTRAVARATIRIIKGLIRRMVRGILKR